MKAGTLRPPGLGWGLRGFSRLSGQQRRDIISGVFTRFNESWARRMSHSVPPHVRTSGSATAASWSSLRQRHSCTATSSHLFPSSFPSGNGGVYQHLSDPITETHLNDEAVTVADESRRSEMLKDLPFRFEHQPQSPHFPYPNSVQVLRGDPPKDSCSSKCQPMASREVRKLGDGNCDCQRYGRNQNVLRTPERFRNREIRRVGSRRKWKTWQSKDKGDGTLAEERWGLWWYRGAMPCTSQGVRRFLG